MGAADRADGGDLRAVGDAGATDEDHGIAVRRGPQGSPTSASTRSCWRSGGARCARGSTQRRALGARVRDRRAYAVTDELHQTFVERAQRHARSTWASTPRARSPRRGSSTAAGAAQGRGMNARPLQRLPIESRAADGGVRAGAPRPDRGWRSSLLAALGLSLRRRRRPPCSRAVALPWSLLNLYLARRAPGRGAEPAHRARRHRACWRVVEVVAPETYGAVRFLALAFLAVHAHFQGERIGIAVAALAHRAAL